MKTTITLQKSWLAGGEEWHIRFPYDSAIISQLRLIKGSRWSAAGRCWIVPGGKQYEEYLSAVLCGYTLNWHRTPDDSIHRKNAIKQHESALRFKTEEARDFHAWMLQRRYSLNTLKVYAQSVDYFLSSLKPKRCGEITPAIQNSFCGMK